MFYNKKSMTDKWAVQTIWTWNENGKAFFTCLENKNHLNEEINVF